LLRFTFGDTGSVAAMVRVAARFGEIEGRAIVFFEDFAGALATTLLAIFFEAISVLPPLQPA
jgi:hypothetical protein